MMTPDRKSEPDWTTTLETARPEQIERLLRDIMQIPVNVDRKPGEKP